MLTLTVSPSIVTIRPNSTFDPNVGTAQVLVMGSPYQSTIYLTTGIVTPVGWVGLASFSPAGGLTPVASVMSITAASNCPFGTFRIPIEARTSTPPYDVAYGIITVNVTPLPTHKLTLQCSPGGHTSPPVAEYQLTEIASFGISATADLGNSFQKWMRDGYEVSLSDHIIIEGLTADTVVKAYFVIQYAVTVESSIGGTVDPAPGTLIHIPAGTSIHLIAYAQGGYRLDYWSFNGAQDGNMLDWYYTPRGDVLIRAEFVSMPPDQRLLTIKTVGYGITSPAANAWPFLVGTVTKVTATPLGGSTFIGWTLDSVPITGDVVSSILITMDTNHTLTATFQGGKESDNTLAVLLIGGALVAAAIALSG